MALREPYKGYVLRSRPGQTGRALDSARPHRAPPRPLGPCTQLVPADPFTTYLTRKEAERASIQFGKAPLRFAAIQRIERPDGAAACFQPLALIPLIRIGRPALRYGAATAWPLLWAYAYRRPEAPREEGVAERGSCERQLGPARQPALTTVASSSRSQACESNGSTRARPLRLSLACPALGIQYQGGAVLRAAGEPIVARMTAFVSWPEAASTTPPPTHIGARRRTTTSIVVPSPTQSPPMVCGSRAPTMVMDHSTNSLEARLHCHMSRRVRTPCAGRQ